MSRMYGRDKVKVTPVTRDSALGTATKGEPFFIKCMVEDTTETENKANGRPAGSSIYIFMPPDTVIKRTDYIQVTERFGKVVSETEKVVIQATGYGDFKKTHWEVYA